MFDWQGVSPSVDRQGQGGGDAGLGSKFSAGVVLGALSGLLASPFDLVRIRRLTLAVEKHFQHVFSSFFPNNSRVQAEAGRLDTNGLLTTGLRAGHSCQITGTVPRTQNGP